MMKDMVPSTREEDETFINAMQMALGVVFSMTMNAAVDLGLLDIIATGGSGGSGLSVTEITSRLSGCTNKEAPQMVERILRLLVSHGVLCCSVDENGDRLYGLTPVAKYFVPDEDGVSLGPLMALLHDNVCTQNWTHLKDAVLKGGMPFTMSHGTNLYHYKAIDPRFNQLFDISMSHHSSLVSKKVLEAYKGFDQVNHLVDVGGGIGITLNVIVSKHPHIKGTNFDLPHVIQNAPPYPGVEHVAGDMFESVPVGDAVFLKWIIHSWDDEHCVKLLKNCHKAISETGKVIVMDPVFPEAPDGSLAAKDISQVDLSVMVLMPDGKVRTQQQLEALAAESGFMGIRFVCSICNLWIMEFFK